MQALLIPELVFHIVEYLRGLTLLRVRSLSWIWKEAVDQVGLSNMPLIWRCVISGDLKLTFDRTKFSYNGSRFVMSMDVIQDEGISYFVYPGMRLKKNKRMRRIKYGASERVKITDGTIGYVRENLSNVHRYGLTYNCRYKYPEFCVILSFNMVRRAGRMRTASSPYNFEHRMTLWWLGGRIITGRFRVGKRFTGDIYVECSFHAHVDGYNKQVTIYYNWYNEFDDLDFHPFQRNAHQVQTTAPKYLIPIADMFRQRKDWLIGILFLDSDYSNFCLECAKSHWRFSSGCKCSHRFALEDFDPDISSGSDEDWMAFIPDTD